MTNSEIILEAEASVNNEIINGEGNQTIVDFFRTYNICSQDLTKNVTLDKRIIIPKDFINKATDKEEIEKNNYRSAIPTLIPDESTLKDPSISSFSNGANYVSVLMYNKHDNVIIVKFVKEMKDINLIGLVDKEGKMFPYIQLRRVSQVGFGQAVVPCYFYDNTEKLLYIRDPDEQLVINFYSGIKEIALKKLGDDDYLATSFNSEPEISYDFHTLYVYFYA